MDTKKAYEDHVINAFEKFCRRVIENAATDYERIRQKQSNQVELTNMLIEISSELQHTDSYINESCFEFKVLEYVVSVHNLHLADALNALPERKRNIILLYYFLDMTDEEIGEAMRTMRRTVNVIRNKSIQELKALIGDAINED